MSTPRSLRTRLPEVGFVRARPSRRGGVYSTPRDAHWLIRTRNRCWRTAAASVIVILSLSAVACSSSGSETSGAASTAAANSSSTASNQKVQDITVGLTSFNSLHLELLVGQAEHIFRQHGVQIKLPALQTDTLGVPGIVSGSLQFAPFTYAGLYLAQAKSNKVKAIAVEGTGLPYLLIANKNIRSIADLRGKTIGVNAVGASLDYLAIAGMIAAQSPSLLSQIKFINAGPPSARVAALSSGKVAAVGSFPPASLKLLRHGGVHVIAKSGTYTGGLRGQFDCIIANPAWYNSHHDLAVKFMQGYLASIKWLYDPANKDEAIKDLATAQKVDTTDATTTYNTFVTKLKIWPKPEDAASDPTSMAKAANYFIKAGVKGLPSGASAMAGRYSNSLVQSALEAGI